MPSKSFEELVRWVFVLFNRDVEGFGIRMLLSCTMLKHIPEHGFTNFIFRVLLRNGVGELAEDESQYQCKLDHNLYPPTYDVRPTPSFTGRGSGNKRHVRTALAALRCN